MITIYTKLPEPWDDAAERAKAAGYSLYHIAGYNMLEEYGRAGGPFGVFKDGKLLAGFDSAVARDKWLHKVLGEQP
jgi:hypothetical protein